MIEDLIKFGGKALMPKEYDCKQCGSFGCIHDAAMMAEARQSNPFANSEPSEGDLVINDMPESGLQLHTHNEGSLFDHAHFKTYGQERIDFQLDSYQSAMADLMADNLGLPKKIIDF